ncbi:uncharacterized protein LOC113238665 [Hyposmocoma kahamanoa]|uniref:uncharacterized protein LOC113238665 n=1 Tax=Hyposmocoma kahamanoa TaxID=1477025 RepID=UPI000E6D9043|nr:uncharacterized protein LOC113238665 [Hyposmocoma kahamanoa]
MEGSPFNRSALTRRSPPPTPSSQPPAPAESLQNEDPPDVVSTPEIQNWMSAIEQCLNEVCAISTEGKLNSDQKLRISTLCRKVANGTSQLAVQYQSLKQKAVQAYSSLKALKENQDLSQRLQDLKQRIEESTNPLSSTVSFADMVKKSSNNFVQPNKISSVAIYPTDKLKSSDETKNLVQKIIRPEEMKLHVRGLRKTKNGGVIISTDSKDDLEKLKQVAQLKTSGLTVDEPHKRKPRIVIIGVPTSLQETEVVNCIFQQNLADKLQGMSLESFLNNIKLSHKSGKKNTESCNYIFEVAPRIRKALITNDRVFVNWLSCPVRDFTLVTRCFKCQQYGHAAKTCREEATICGHCGEAGHTIKDCTKKTEPPKCATCLHFKKTCDHQTGDFNCPARKMAEKRYINSIDYEGA